MPEVLDKKLEIQRLSNSLDPERLSKEDFVNAFEKVVKFILANEQKLTDAVARLEETYQNLTVKNRDDYVAGLTDLKKQTNQLFVGEQLKRMDGETKELPVIGGAIGNIPGLNELLPTKYSMFEDKPLQREQSLLRQLTGITLKTKPFIEKELDRMGKDVGDLIPKTGNLEANRIISKQTGVILDQFNEKLNLSEKYQAMGNDEKLEFIKNLVSEAKKEAKGEAASDLAGVVYNELKKVSSEKRKETIIQLKNRGLMTENILDYLMPMLEAQPLAK